MTTSNRGGVEDTMLEAKDTKNLKPRTALTRTDSLEAKDRNAQGQGHNAEVISEKKKVFAQKIRKLFAKSGVLQKKEDLALKFRKYSENFKYLTGKKLSSKIFLQALWRSSRRNKIDHYLDQFSTSQK